jgi:hypothetical protein
MAEKSCNLKIDDVWPLGNILNEICHGVDVVSFEEKIGAKYEDIDRLLEKISKIYKESKAEQLQEITLALNEEELQIIEKSFREVLNHLDWDFPIRVGIEIVEAEKIINKLGLSV